MKPSMPSHLLDERPLQVLPSLVIALGSLEQAVILQQIHWRLRITPTDHFFPTPAVPEIPATDTTPAQPAIPEGDVLLPWVYDTYEDWAAHEFPWLSARAVRRYFLQLEETGVLLSTDAFNSFRIDRTKWYSIDYDALERLLSRITDSADGAPESGASDAPESGARGAGKWRVLDAPESGAPITEGKRTIQSKHKNPGDSPGASQPVGSVVSGALGGLPVEAAGQSVSNGYVVSGEGSNELGVSGSQLMGESETDTVVPIHLGSPAARKNGKAKSAAKDAAAKSAAAAKLAIDEPLFAAIWEAWPKKHKEEESFRAFQARCLNAEDWEAIRAGVNRHVRHWRTEGTSPALVPNLADWLWRRRWNEPVYALGDD